MSAAPGGEGRWRVIASSVRGSSHVTSGKPNQDAVAWADLPGGGVVAAVSDGHGSDRSPRSDRGSRLAVAAACQVTTEMVTAPSSAVELEHVLRSAVLPVTVARWRSAVRADLDGDPLDGVAGDPLLPYGATLLVAVASGGVVAAAQIGDGDVVVGRQPASSDHLIVPDDRFVAGETSSLCLDDALSYVRAAVADGDEPPAFVLLATDGYGNSFADEHWAASVGSDLLSHLRSQGPEWVQQRLDDWLAESAQVGGDDVTVAVLVPASADGPVVAAVGDAPAHTVPAPAALPVTADARPQPLAEPAPSSPAVAPVPPAAGSGAERPSGGGRTLALALALGLILLALVVGFAVGRATAGGDARPARSTVLTTTTTSRPTTTPTIPLPIGPGPGPGSGTGGDDAPDPPSGLGD